jgi:hypothetical protein
MTSTEIRVEDAGLPGECGIRAIDGSTTVSIAKVTVEHVNVHEGGQAIVGNVQGGGMQTKLENQLHALGYAPGQTLRSTNAEREALPVAGDGKR